MWSSGQRLERRGVDAGLKVNYLGLLKCGDWVGVALFDVV